MGKTTITLGLAAAAQRAGDPCLVIDLDPQGSAGWALGVEASNEYLSVGDVLRTGDPAVAAAATVTSGWGAGIDVLPSSRNLIDREGDATDSESALRLRRAVAPLASNYRFVLIDCAPSLGPITRSGLAAADLVFLVVELSALSIRGAEAQPRYRRGYREPIPLCLGRSQSSRGVAQPSDGKAVGVASVRSPAHCLE